MTLSTKIEKAIRKAAVLHAGQLRKDKTTPYISHLVSVMLIVSEYTSDEDTLVAALLHDTLEDTKYSAKDLEEDFGSKVKKIVEAVTMEYERSGKKVPWREDRENYLKRLETEPDEVMLICAADKIHNLNSWSEFKNSKNLGQRQVFFKSKEKIEWFYGGVLRVLEQRFNSPIVDKLRESYLSLIR